MKCKLGILLLIFCIGMVSNTFAVSPQKRTFENTTVEMGTSTENIMPLLANIAGNWKGYLTSIYGQYRLNYILIEMVTNKTTYDVEKIKKKARDTLENNIMVFYPNSEGMISVEVSDLNCIVFEYSKGQIKDKSILVNVNTVKTDSEKDKSYRKELWNRKLKGELVCDLERGFIASIKVGDHIKREEIIKIIGEEPNDDSCFYESGINIQDGEDIITKQWWVYGITVFLKGSDVLPVQEFKGIFIPPLTKNESKTTIRDKFGEPLEVENSGRNWEYSKSYGKLGFLFDEKGELYSLRISVSPRFSSH